MRRLSWPLICRNDQENLISCLFVGRVGMVSRFLAVVDDAAGTIASLIVAFVI